MEGVRVDEASANSNNHARRFAPGKRKVKNMKSLFTSLQPTFSSWRMKLASLALCGTAAWFCLAAASRPYSEHGDGGRQAPPIGDKLPGAWSVEVTTVLQGTWSSLMTFTSDGTMLADEPPGPGETTGHGNWVPQGRNAARFTFRTFIAVELAPGVVTSDLKVVGELEYDSASDAWTGPFKIQIFDPAGNPVFEDTGTFKGTRIPVEHLH